MRNHKPYSIKNRLIISSISLTSLFVALSLYFSYWSSNHEIFEVYDARLGQTAKVFAGNFPLYEFESQQTHDDHRDNHHLPDLQQWMEQIRMLSATFGDTTPYGHKYESEILVQAYSQNALMWSSNPQIAELNTPSGFSGYGYTQRDGEMWRYFLLRVNVENPQHGEYIVAAEKQEIRDEMMKELALSAMAPQLALIPCIVIAMFFLINRLFAPINTLQTAISKRNINHLGKIQVSNQTTELAPLIDALNRLLEELEKAWQRERSFTRMAAHELKTPLAILRLNAENALLASNPQDLQHDLSNILSGIDRSSRLIQQLLTLARVESIHSLNPTQLNLDSLLQQVVADLVPLALKNNQEISYVGIPAQVQGDESLLRILFGNLIDNAIRYSGKGSEITISVSETPHHYLIDVADNGKLIAPEVRDKLFENFYRCNRETGDGAGLGLAITRDIARIHGGEIELLQKNVNQNTFSVRLIKSNDKIVCN